MPYKCTAEVSCTKTFEKYVDWCSHESITHKNDLDVWVCNRYPTDPAGNCNLAFRHELDFVEHRNMKHNDSNVISRDYAVGPKVASYYCGFCQSIKTIDPANKDQTMTARLRHITAHYDAGHFRDNWVPQPVYWVFTEGVSRKKDLQFIAHSSTL